MYRKKSCLIVVVFLIAAILYVFYNLDPAGSNLFPPCLFYKTTGLYCPGCGTQRALHQLLHGHLLNSFRYNPLPFLLALLLPAFYLCNRFTGYIKSSYTGRQSWLIVWIICGYFIARNLPFLPFLEP